MPDFALAAAGATVFALTTWASLAFGYQVFQTMWETDQADDVAPDGLPTDAVAGPAAGVDGTDAAPVRPSDLALPAAPAA